MPGPLRGQITTNVSIAVPPIQCIIHWLCARYKLFLWLWLLTFLCKASSACCIPNLLKSVYFYGKIQKPNEDVFQMHHGSSSSSSHRRQNGVKTESWEAIGRGQKAKFHNPPIVSSYLYRVTVGVCSALGLFCRWPEGLECTSRRSPGSHAQQWQFPLDTQDIPIRWTLTACSALEADAAMRYRNLRLTLTLTKRV